MCSTPLRSLAGQPLVVYKKIERVSMMPRKMTTVSIGKLLVAIGNAILEESPPPHREPESAFRLKRHAGKPAARLPVKRRSAESDTPEHVDAPVAEVSESKVHEIEAITKEPVSNEAPDAADVPEPRVNLARALTEQREQAVETVTRAKKARKPTLASESQAPESTAAEATQQAPRESKPVEKVTIDWNEFLEPCPSSEATSAVKVLEAAFERHGETVTRQNFKRSMQTVVKKPDGGYHRVFNHPERGVAWKLK